MNVYHIMVFVLIGALCLSSVLVYKMSLRAVESSQRSHERSYEYNKDLLDRLMSVDYNQYRAYTGESTPTATYVPPARKEKVIVGDHTRRGFGSDLGLQALVDEELEHESS